MTTLLFTPERYPLHSWVRLKHMNQMHQHRNKWQKAVATMYWLLGEDA